MLKVANRGNIKVSIRERGFVFILNNTRRKYESKKILILIIIIVLIAVLAIVGINIYKNSKEYSFKATILEVSPEEERILVNIPESEGEGMSGKMYVYLNNTTILESDGKEININVLKANDNVIITMCADETIVATNPGILRNTLKLEIVE